jgi:uncharacterized protein (AIM24 family)
MAWMQGDIEMKTNTRGGLMAGLGRAMAGESLFMTEGFILQKITGPGKAFLEIPGEMKEYHLKPQDTLLVDPGHIALFEPTVNFEIETVKGLKNMLFSGKGLFLAKLTGPGKVWLQSMPIANLAAKLAKYLPSKS